mgnify:CR=1 FL=1
MKTFFHSLHHCKQPFTAGDPDNGVIELQEFTSEIDVPIHTKRQLIAIKHFFHDMCFNAKKQVEMSTIPKARFGYWRASECAPGSCRAATAMYEKFRDFQHQHTTHCSSAAYDPLSDRPAK